MSVSDGTVTDSPTTEGVATPTETEHQAAYSEECGRAMEAAASVGDMEDTVEDTDPAIIACASVDEFSAASADYPAALDGTDVTTWLTNRCQFAGTRTCSHPASALKSAARGRR